MKVDLDYVFFQEIYLRNDAEQATYLLKRIILAPKGKVILELFSPLGDIVEAEQEFCSKERILIFDKD